MSLKRKSSSFSYVQSRQKSNEASENEDKNIEHSMERKSVRPCCQNKLHPPQLHDYLQRKRQANKVENRRRGQFKQEKQQRNQYLKRDRKNSMISIQNFDSVERQNAGNEQKQNNEVDQALQISFQNIKTVQKQKKQLQRVENEIDIRPQTMDMNQTLLIQEEEYKQNKYIYLAMENQIKQVSARKQQSAQKNQKDIKQSPKDKYLSRIEKLQLSSIFQTPPTRNQQIKKYQESKEQAKKQEQRKSANFDRKQKNQSMLRGSPHQGERFAGITTPAQQQKVQKQNQYNKSASASSIFNRLKKSPKSAEQIKQQINGFIQNQKSIKKYIIEPQSSEIQDKLVRKSQKSKQNEQKGRYNYKDQDQKSDKKSNKQNKILQKRQNQSEKRKYNKERQMNQNNEEQIIKHQTQVKKNKKDEQRKQQKNHFNQNKSRMLGKSKNQFMQYNGEKYRQLNKEIQKNIKKYQRQAKQKEKSYYEALRKQQRLIQEMQRKKKIEEKQKFRQQKIENERKAKKNSKQNSRQNSDASFTEQTKKQQKNKNIGRKSLKQNSNLSKYRANNLKQKESKQAKIQEKSNENNKENNPQSKLQQLKTSGQRQSTIKSLSRRLYTQQKYEQPQQNQKVSRHQTENKNKKSYIQQEYQRQQQKQVEQQNDETNQLQQFFVGSENDEQFEMPQDFDKEIEMYISIIDEKTGKKFQRKYTSARQGSLAIGKVISIINDQ